MRYYKHRLWAHKPYDIDFGWVFTTQAKEEYLADTYRLQDEQMQRDSKMPRREFNISQTVEIRKEDFEAENEFALPIHQYDYARNLGNYRF